MDNHVIKCLIYPNTYTMNIISHENMPSWHSRKLFDCHNECLHKPGT